MKLIKLDYDPEICYFGSYYLEKFQLRIQQNSSSIIAFLAETILEAPETTTDLRILGKMYPVPFPMSQISGTDLKFLN